MIDKVEEENLFDHLNRKPLGLYKFPINKIQK